MGKSQYVENQVPVPGEICTVSTMGAHKRSAFLFDRIWVQRTNSNDFDAIDTPKELSFGLQEIDETIVDQVVTKISKSSKDIHEIASNVIPHLQRTVSEEYSKRGILVIPTYSTEEAFKEDYKEGKTRNFQAALTHIPVVNENEVSWEQIIEFRHDKESIRKYRELRVWLRDVLETSSLDQATDVIGKKIEDYERSLKTHGISTVIGGMSQVIGYLEKNKGKTSLAIASWLAGPIWATVASTGLIVAGASVWVAEKMLEHEMYRETKTQKLQFY